jgi:GTP-binding protein LepA
MELCQESRAAFTANMQYLVSRARDPRLRRCRSIEIVIDFFDQLKSGPRATPRSTTSCRVSRPRTSSSSMSCSTAIPSTRFSIIVHRDKAYELGRMLTEKLRRADPPAAVRRADPGRDRRERDRPSRRSRRDAQGRARQVLRRRHHAQAQAAREAEGRQEAHEAVGRVEVPQEAFLAVLELATEPSRKGSR